MKHTLPLAIVLVAAAAAVTGIIAFRSGTFQTASVGEVMTMFNKSKTFSSPDAVEEISDTRFTTPQVSDPIILEPAIAVQQPVCTTTTKPWIHVISPRGDETYAPGSTVNVRWVSCNVTDRVQVALLWKDSKNGSGGSTAAVSANDYQETITLPKQVGMNATYYSGKLYKVQVVQSTNGSPNYHGAIDASDYFSIR